MIHQMRAFNCCREQSNPEELWNERKVSDVRGGQLISQTDTCASAVVLKPLNATEPVRDVRRGMQTTELCGLAAWAGPGCPEHG